MTEPQAMLRTYLQDHHAGATVGGELARRAAGSNSESEYGPELEAIAGEIAEDREILERVMELLEVKPNPLKDAAGWTAEKFGRLKPNNSILSYSPLSRVVELEGLVIGVTGKLALWQSLRTALGERLEALRERAAAEAFGGTQPASSANARRASPGSA